MELLLTEMRSLRIKWVGILLSSLWGVDEQFRLGHIEIEMISTSLNICSLISDALLISVAWTNLCINAFITPSLENVCLLLHYTIFEGPGP